jgi:hypothetical protein
MRSVAYVLSAVVVCAGCRARTTEQQAPAPATDTLAVGTLDVVGSYPTEQLVLRPRESAPLAIVGDLAGELRQLVGLEIRVRGAVAPGIPPASRAIAARAYEPIALRGVPVRMGTIEQQGESVWLAGAERLALAVVPDKLRAAVGSRVWIAGEVVEGRLLVEAFGVISRPREP